MANRPAAGLVLRDGDHEVLTGMVRSTSGRAGLAVRARIVLLASRGQPNAVIAEQVGASRPTVNHWRRRYQQYGVEGLHDQQRPGRPRVVSHDKVVAATLRPPPKKYGVTHWSSRLLGKHLGVSNGTVAKAWREYGIKPWRLETFTFSTDPELEAKVTDIVGLYLNPRAPRGADESSGGERPSPPRPSQRER